MDVNQDVDIDSLLLQQFSCIQTQDREVLISELQNVIGNQMSVKDCEFFLDMNNWNLQGAVWSYFEYCQTDGGIGPVVVSLPKMCVVQDHDSISTGIHRDTRTVLPGQTFTQAWKIMNCGTERWPPGCCLRYFAGPQMSSVDRISVDGIQPGGLTNVQLTMTAPAEPGVYTTQWKMTTITGTYFGELLCVGVQVTTDISAAVSEEDVASRFSSLMAHDTPPPVQLTTQSDPSLHLQPFNNQQMIQISSDSTSAPDFSTTTTDQDTMEMS